MYAILLFIVKSSLQCATEVINLIDWLIERCMMTSVIKLLASIHQSTLHPHAKPIILDNSWIISSAQCQTTIFDDIAHNRRLKRRIRRRSTRQILSSRHVDVDVKTTASQPAYSSSNAVAASERWGCGAAPYTQFRVSAAEGISFCTRKCGQISCFQIPCLLSVRKVWVPLDRISPKPLVSM